MAFEWEKINIGEHISSFNIKQIRSNLDLIKDNIVCITYNSNVYLNKDSTVRVGLCSYNHTDHDFYVRLTNDDSVDGVYAYHSFDY